MKQYKIRNKNISIIVIGVIIFLLYNSMINNNLFFPLSHASSWDQTTYSDFDNGTLTNLTIFGSNDNSRLEINLSELQTWTLKKTSNVPFARYEHAMASIYGTDKVLLFGGYTFTGNYRLLDDTWIYDLSDNTWTQKIPTSKPGARQSHAMASVYGDDKVILFGGSNNWDSQLNDVWVYDLSNNTWSNEKSGPVKRQLHTMASVNGDDKIILYGGQHYDGVGFQYFNGTWVYDVSEDNWTLKASGPNGRYMHAMAAIDDDDKFIIYGGISPLSPIRNFNETWIYDYGDNKWTQKFPKENPGGRFQHGMTRINGTDEVLLFGGHYISHDNDTWLYDLSENTWIIKETVDSPQVRDQHQMASIYGDDRVVMFGGYHHEGGGNFYDYDDTWIYRHFLPTKNGTFISSAFDCGHNSSFKEFFAYTKIPENTSIKFQLRTEKSESDLKLKDFVGPDGNKTSYYSSTSSSHIWSGHNGDRWIQYMAYLNLTVVEKSPSVNEVSIIYNCLPANEVIGPIEGIMLTNNKPTFSWIFIDHDSVHQKAFQVVISDEIAFTNISFDSSVQNSTEQFWKFPIGTQYKVLPDGIWYWKIRCKDDGDDWTDFSSPRSLIIDTKSPNSVTTNPVNDGLYNSLSNISGNAFDISNGSGLNKVQIAIRSLMDNKYWNGVEWVNFIEWLDVYGTDKWTYDSTNINWSSGNRYNIQSRAIDYANNIEIPNTGNFFLIDKESPESSISSINNKMWINDLDIISGTAIDYGNSGVDKVEITIKCVKDTVPWDGPREDNKYWTGSSWSPMEHRLPAIETNQWLYNTENVPWSNSNHYQIRSQAIDRAGNKELPYEGKTFIYDNQTPESLSIIINNNDRYTNSTVVSLLLIAEDSGSGISEMAFSTDKIKWSNWEPYNQTRSYIFPYGDSEKILYFKVRDIIGNIAEPVYDTIILDTTPPDDLKIVIEENTKYTSSREVDLSLFATDGLSGLNQMSFSYDKNTWYTWEPFNLKRTISLPYGNGEKTVYFNVKDNANNFAQPIYDSIIFDDTPPYSLSISINNGAEETNSTLVNLKLNAFDNLSGISQMSFSFDGDTWTNWLQFSNERMFTLSANEGEKTIFFRVKDNANNIAGPVSATIILKNTLPPEEKLEEKTTYEGQEQFLILMGILLLILIISILVMVLIIKRRKRYVQELLPPGIIAQKTGGLFLPKISGDVVLSSLKEPELPTPIRAKEALPPVESSKQKPIPILPKSTKSAQESKPSYKSQVSQLPPVSNSQNQTISMDVGGSQTNPTITTETQKNQIESDIIISTQIQTSPGTLPTSNVVEKPQAPINKIKNENK